MRWNKRVGSAGVPPAVRWPALSLSNGRLAPRVRQIIAASFLFITLLSAAPEKHLSIYSTAASYSLSLAQHDGHDYIGLIELLEPLGERARSPPSSMANTGNCISTTSKASFKPASRAARVQGRDADLSFKFVLENGRGLVPIACLSSLLPRFFGGPVTCTRSRTPLRRSVATHFTALLSGENPSRLVFNFTAPVSP